ncbi:anaerobic ribonucleoside-triphosphate reductase activating protein [Parcubacteria bacterium DG_74_1]|nr:MAG: anaerobic ribonucleoside-triphosphate reductase activating protein [Parcubacteria bacterium DG_74_1]
MEIGGLQKTTLIDFPGRIAATIFLCGCNFRCPFCYSGELVLPEKIKKQPKILEKDFFDFLKERKGLLEGVVLCGGEPTIHRELSDFCRKIKALGFLIKLDTNGSNPAVLKEIIEDELLDYVAMDIKAPKEKYDFFSGAKLVKKVEESINILKESQLDYEFRTTVAPGLKQEDIFSLSEWIAGKGVNYFLQEFNSQKEVLNPDILNLPVLKKEELEEIIRKIRPKFKTCYLR